VNNKNIEEMEEIIAEGKQEISENVVVGKQEISENVVVGKQEIPEEKKSEVRTIGGELINWLRESKYVLLMSAKNVIYAFGTEEYEGKNVLAYYKTSVMDSMNIRMSNDNIWLTTKGIIWGLRNEGESEDEENKIGKYDRVYKPKTLYNVGAESIVDIQKTSMGAIFYCEENSNIIKRVNISNKEGYNIVYKAEEHTNILGICMKWNEIDKKKTPRFITVKEQNNGKVIDIHSNVIMCEGFNKPITPTWINDKLWLIDEERGSVGYIKCDYDQLDKEGILEKVGEYVEVKKVNGKMKGLKETTNHILVGIMIEEDQINESTKQETSAELPITNVVESEMSESTKQESTAELEIIKVEKVKRSGVIVMKKETYEIEYLMICDIEEINGIEVIEDSNRIKVVF